MHAVIRVHDHDMGGGQGTRRDQAAFDLQPFVGHAGAGFAGGQGKILLDDGQRRVGESYRGALIADEENAEVLAGLRADRAQGAFAEARDERPVARGLRALQGEDENQHGERILADQIS